MRKFRTHDEMALYVWDYFYLARRPREGEARAWRRIECATERLKESVQRLTDRFPPEIRYTHAKRVRRATREIGNKLAQLESIPEPWVIRAVATLEALADRVIAETPEEARGVVFH
jgi:predicted nicotinamide N-methyase